MAGISLIKSKNNLTDSKPEIITAIKSLNFHESYKDGVYLSEEGVFIGWNKYDTYPLEVLEAGDYKIIVEGKIYNKSNEELRSELLKVSENYSDAYLRSWITGADGDFIIYTLNKLTGKLIVFNDILGRLPVYYYYNSETLYISRYFRFITALEKNIKLDRTALGEVILLGYLLGNRTFFENIKQLRPGSSIVSDESGTRVSIVNDFNFDVRDNKDKKLKTVIDEASELFAEGCRNRFSNNRTNLIALSSGMDSRTVAACLAKNNIPFKTTTMVFTNGAAKEETPVAKEIASLFGADWQPSVLQPPKGYDVKKLLLAKEGMNFLAVSFILPFYRKIEEMYGTDINFITGDKGDKVTLTYDNPIDRFGSVEEAVKYILDEHGMLDINDIPSVLKVDKNDIYNDLLNLVNSYPEQDLSQRYIHFRAIEKSHKLAYHGDDRHKRFLWSYCPLTSVPFVLYMFNCSNEQKKLHNIFTGLLESYSTPAANILYTNFRAPINSFKGKLFMGAVYYLYPRVKPKTRGKIKEVFFGGNPFITSGTVYYNVIDQQLSNSPAISDYFNMPNAESMKNKRMTLLQSLFTVTSVADEYLSRKPVLDNYLNEEFDQLKT